MYTLRRLNELLAQEKARAATAVSQASGQPRRAAGPAPSMPEQLAKTRQELLLGSQAGSAAS